MPETDFEIEVKVALIRKRMTQRAFAEELGITTPYLSDILRGNRKGGKYRGLIKEKLEIKGIC
jgi:transcriptional regulator with XRE-family HTH domain